MGPTWNNEFELPDGPYSISDIQSYLEHIIKKREKLTDNSPIEIYIIFYIIYNKIEITRNLSKKNIFSERFNSQFLHIEVWFTYKNVKPLEKEDKLN